MWFSVLLLVPLCFGVPFDTPGKSAVAYSDDFARNKMIGLAAGAYMDNPQQCITNSINGTLKRRLNLICDPDKDDTCSGFTAVSHSNKAIAVVFRGTTTDEQTVIEVDETLFDQMVPLAGGKVAKYFFDGFLAIWNGGMKDDFNSLHNQYPDYEIWVTGHSLGGAMAAICSSYLTSIVGIEGYKLKLVTFGEPRVGDKNFAMSHDSTIKYSFRITHHRDIAPHIPLEVMGYYHHKSEVWYDNDMSGPNFVVCDNDEDKSCSDGTLDINGGDHQLYFHEIHPWAEAGCKN